MAQNLSNDHINLTMLTDFYEITMANGYFTNGFKDTIGYFDMFFRKVPDGGGFAIMAGVEQLVNYLSELSFTQEDIDYLRSKHIFREEFLDYLKNFKFTCDVWAVPEGTPIFPGEPIVTVRGPVIQAQFVETMVLLSINHQSLIATKTNRIVRAADGRAVMEFGSRRAQGFDRHQFPVTVKWDFRHTRIPFPGHSRFHAKIASKIDQCRFRRISYFLSICIGGIVTEHAAI